MRKGTFGRAKVRLHDEPGGTPFEVRGQGFLVTVKVANDHPIGQAPEYRDGS